MLYFLPLRLCPDPAKTGTVVQLGAAPARVPTHPFWALCMNSSTQVSLLSLPHNCLGEPGSASSSQDGLAGGDEAGVMGEEGVPFAAFISWSL